MSLPTFVDLRPGCPAPYDQLTLGSCTGQAIGALIHYNLIKEDPRKAFQPSALFIYYCERVLENTINEDAGAEIRDGIKSLVRWGVCPEQYHPYVVSKFKTKPSKLAYNNAYPHRISQYMRIEQRLDDLKSCLADGFPFVFGFSCYDSFESDEVARTGALNVPGRNEKDLGGHAVMCVGYDSMLRHFIIRNSWGASWGMEGYFTMPYDYILSDDLAADFWTVKFVPNE
jgi:C1A family cysteine protease